MSGLTIRDIFVITYYKGKKMKNETNIKEKFIRLVKIMDKLRSETGCPWDREQTHESLRQFLLEEAYEVLELIDAGQYSDLQNELGDLLLQVIFHSQIAEEEGLFNIENVLLNINEKLINRHPNVFGNVIINNAQEQIVNWEKMKQKEGKKSVIDGVPKELSALLRAHRIQAKAATVGFDWQNAQQVWQKVEEEIGEFKEALNNSNPDAIEEEFGDILFSLVNLSRFIKVNPEDALRRTINKFADRFKKVETEMARQEKTLADSTLEEMDAIWEKVKQKKV